MKNYTVGLLLIFLFLSCRQKAPELSYQINGLNEPVEIIVDQWGIPHIYAQNEEDLFFAQGFQAAQDRLFQFEIWRRQATGTVAELLGERELERDIGARLFAFRGDMQKEMQHYHPDGEKIITSFVQGVNAYIEMTEKDPGLLPIEFQLLGTKPQKWTPEVVVSRHQGLLGNIEDEISTARMVALVGEEKTKEIMWFHPNDPNLKIDEKIPQELLFQDVIAPYNAFRKSVEFKPEDIIADAANDLGSWEGFQEKIKTQKKDWLDDVRNVPGSNNWVIGGEKTTTGYPIMANDPHRRHSAPSLRYMAHLVAPGWNVIGGGEPELPGISIGHNEYGAWGLTVFRTDAEDLYVYDTNPENPNQYWYQGAWEDMQIIYDTIPVKGKDPIAVEYKYTRHGPVTYENSDMNKACAMRCGWLETGGSPYLASLRMDQSKTWSAFRDACNYSHIPGENMIWADREGNIGWQAVGIAPIRRNFSGFVPVPGDGTHEWDGYLPIIEKPNVYNPPEGFFATANANVTPADYPHMDAIGFSWSDPFRHQRVTELLTQKKLHSMEDMAAYQTDYFSIPASQLVPLLKEIKFENAATESANEKLADWDLIMLPNSIAAGIYNKWEKEIRDSMELLAVPKETREYDDLQMKKVMDWIKQPDEKFGAAVTEKRNEFLQKTFENAVNNLQNELGDDMNNWQYGQANYKHIAILHPLSPAVDETTRKQLEVGPAPRGGNSYTVNNTGSGNRQTHGASFRIIVDTKDWDNSIGCNSPGQSGDPALPHYRNLFDLWAKDQFFPVLYSKEKIKAAAYLTTMLAPGK